MTFMRRRCGGRGHGCYGPQKPESSPEAAIYRSGAVSPAGSARRRGNGSGSYIRNKGEYRSPGIALPPGYAASTDGPEAALGKRAAFSPARRSWPPRRSDQRRPGAGCRRPRSQAQELTTHLGSDVDQSARSKTEGQAGKSVRIWSEAPDGFERSFRWPRPVAKPLSPARALRQRCEAPRPRDSSRRERLRWQVRDRHKEKW